MAGSLALPTEDAHRSLTTLREKLVKIGANVGAQHHLPTCRGRDPENPIANILRLIDRLRPAPLPP